RHLKVLESLEKTIVRDNGLIRYTPFEVTLANGQKTRTFDGYLTPNWGLSAEPDGKLSLYRQAFEQARGMPVSHIEPSTPEGFVARARMADPHVGKTSPGTEAEWFMMAEMARGYGEQLGRFLDSLEGRHPNGQEKRLIQQ